MTDETEDTASRRLFDRRTMIVGGALAASSIAANLRRPDVPFRMLGHHEKLDDLFPKKVGSWDVEGNNGLILPPQDQLRDRIYNSLLTRYYASPTELPVMLLIAYSGTQDGMIQVHRPEVCYPAAGYELLDDHFEPLDVGGGVTVPAHFISTRSTSRHEQLIYWTRIGNAFPTRWWAQHVAVAAENLKGRVPDGMLIRVSTAAATDAQAIDTVKRFTLTMMGMLKPLARRVLLGEAGGKA